MISVSDIIKLLEQVPIWKSVVALPKRIAELEARVKTLETSRGETAISGPNPTDCPGCGARLTFDREQPHKTFSHAGLKTHFLHCDGCGRKFERDWAPGKGYR